LSRHKIHMIFRHFDTRLIHPQQISPFIPFIEPIITKLMQSIADKYLPYASSVILSVV
jgi:hypothetical protein